MIEDKILSLLETEAGGVVRGRQIRKLLGISQIHLLKVLKRLDQDGYVLSFIPPDGYRLKERPDLLTSREIGSGLKSDYIGKKIYCFKGTDSTNAVAYKLASAGARREQQWSASTSVMDEAVSAGAGSHLPL